MRKFLLFMLLGLFVLLCFEQGIADTSGTCGDDLFWTLNNDGQLTISGIGYMNTSFRDSIGIKSVIIQEGVQSICENAFNNCTNLVSVSIPESVKSVGLGAFCGCSSLIEVTLPSNVTYINSYTFKDCTSLQKVSLPKNLQRRGKRICVPVSGKQP